MIFNDIQDCALYAAILSGDQQKDHYSNKIENFDGENTNKSLRFVNIFPYQNFAPYDIIHKESHDQCQ